MTDGPETRESSLPSGMLLQVTLDGIPFDRINTNMQAGTRLKATVSETDYQQFGGIYIFTTPLSAYLEDHQAVFIYDREQTNLGVLPSLTHMEQKEIDLVLEKDCLYDIFYPHGSKLDPVRITTGKAEKPQSLTLDETKFLLAVQIGKRPKDLAGIEATIVADKNQLINHFQYRFYGLQVGDLVATLSRRNIWELILVDRKDFWREVRPQEFAEYLEQFRGKK
ncbi:hypothetical protein C4579_04395 [Candidatus Microgenomates bacterium]|nr:MAG: hypothetical protein C4579_04395 [Candidatus Microgenomates bacterium]